MNSAQFTLRSLLVLVLLVALATAWVRERLSQYGLRMRIEKLEYDISILATIITRNRLTVPGFVGYSEQIPETPSATVQDDYTKDALSHPPY